MRVAHRGISPWLIMENIPFLPERARIYFVLPDHMERYTLITKPLCEELAPFATEVKRRLMALSFSRMGKVRQPLSEEELRLMAEAGIPIIL